MPDPSEALQASAADPDLTAYKDPATGQIQFWRNPPAEKIKALGLQVATPEEVQRRADVLKNTTMGAQAQAAGKLATRTLTFGTSFGDAQSDQQIKDFSAVSPTLSTLTKVAGSVAPALAAGAVTGGVGGVLGLAGRGAAIASTVAEEVAGNTAWEVERAKEEGDQISLGNIALGVGLGAGLTFVGRAAKGLIGKAFSGRAGEAIGDEASPLAQGVRTSAERRSAGAAAAEEGPARAPATAAEVERYATNPEQYHAEVNQVGHDALADAYTGHEGVTGENGGAMRQVHSVAFKEQDVIPHMTEVDAGGVVDALAEHTAAAHATADVLDATGQKLAARRLRMAADLASDAANADEASIAAKGAVGLDRLKREADDILGNYLRNKSVTAKSAAKEIEKFVEPLRSTLQDKGTFGEFWAGKQRGENSLWSGDNGIIQLSNIWQPEVMQLVKGKARVRTGDALAEISNQTPRPDLAEHFLAMPRIKAEKTLAAWESTLDQVDRMTQLKEEAGLLRAPGDMGEDPVATLKASITQQRQTIEELRHIRDVAPRAKPLLDKAAAHSAAQGAGELLFEGLEHVPGLGHGLKAADRISQAVSGTGLKDRLFKPHPLPPQPEITRASALAGLGSRQASRQRGFSDLTLMGGLAGAGALGTGALALYRHRTPTTQALAEVSDNSRKLQERAALGLMVPESRPVPLADPLTRMQGDFPTPESAYSHTIENLVSAASDPRSFAAGLVHAYGEIADGGHQGLFEQLALRTQLGVQYLLANLPPTVGVSLARPNGAAPDMLGMAKFAAMYGAAFHPGDVIHDVASGSATPTQIKTLQAVHPDIYRDLTSEVLKQIGQADGKVPFETLRTLDCLFNFGPLLGRSFSPQFSNILAQGRAQPKGQAQGPNTMTAPSAATDKLGGLSAIR